MRALRLGEARVEVGELAAGAERGGDEARVAEELGGSGRAGAGDLDIRDLALGAAARRARVDGVGQAAEAQARLELGHVGRPDEGAGALEAAEHGDGGRRGHGCWDWG